MGTYREAIQAIVTRLDELYDDVGSLRDSASPDEKETFNKARTFLKTAFDGFRYLDDHMGDSRAQMEIRGDYSKTEKS